MCACRPPNFFQEVLCRISFYRSRTQKVCRPLPVNSLMAAFAVLWLVGLGPWPSGTRGVPGWGSGLPLTMANHRELKGLMCSERSKSENERSRSAEGHAYAPKPSDTETSFCELGTDWGCVHGTYQWKGRDSKEARMWRKVQPPANIHVTMAEGLITKGSSGWWWHNYPSNFVSRNARFAGSSPLNEKLFFLYYWKVTSF